MKKQIITPLFLAIGLLFSPQTGFAMDRGGNSGDFGDNGSYDLIAYGLAVLMLAQMYNDVTAALASASSLAIVPANQPLNLVDGALTHLYDNVVNDDQNILLRHLPPEILMLVLDFSGPRGRTRLWSVSRNFRNVIRVASAPPPLGLGWTDTLFPIVLEYVDGLNDLGGENIEEGLALLISKLHPFIEQHPKIDFVCDPPKCNDLRNIVTTGIDSRGRPFILIKAKEKTSLFNRQFETIEDNLIHIRIEFRDIQGKILKTPIWCVIGGAAFFGQNPTINDLKAKLQEFFQTGLTFFDGSSSWTLKPW